MIIPEAIVKRRLLFDALENAHEVSRLLPDLVPISDDVAKREREESLKRITKIMPLLPMLDRQANWLTEIITKIQIQDEDFAEEQVALIFASVLSMVRSAMVSSLSVLIDLDFVRLGEGTGEIDL